MNSITDNILLSICIPIYNAEKYLPNLFGYLISFNENDVEIVLVDDFSKDNSYKLCLDFSKSRKNVKVVKNSKNLGPAHTYNKAIYLAQGKYIQVCDCDDIIFFEGVIEALEIALKNNAFIVVQPHEEIMIDGTVKTNTPEKIYNGNSMLRKFWEKCNPLLWGLLIRKDIILSNNLNLPPIRMGHDKYFIRNYISLSLNYPEFPICYSSKISYRHVNRIDSITNKDFKNKVEDLMLEFEYAFLQGLTFAKKGLFDYSFMCDSLKKNEASTYLRALYKSASHSRVLVEYKRLKYILGTSNRMKKQFLRALPLGLIQLLIGR
ncbi:glycosyltransferase family 2 protein [Deferribacteraceae bacterium V6Fe1]|nr:glycosyltransferase family 2 protein [Deferribacteraceae bacterium V6Fe1]